MYFSMMTPELVRRAPGPSLLVVSGPLAVPKIGRGLRSLTFSFYVELWALDLA